MEAKKGQDHCFFLKKQPGKKDKISKLEVTLEISKPKKLTCLNLATFMFQQCFLNQLNLLKVKIKMAFFCFLSVSAV